MYALVFKYYSHYGNSNIIYNFKTKNGIDYDDDGFGIGSWCSAQRKKYQSGELSEDKIKKLELINFRFNKIRENIQEKEKLCNLYGIEYNKFKFLTRISYKELYSKIMFLIDNDMPLEIDEKLHPIFTMSNEHMILTYMVGKEDLIIKYYIHNEEKKK